MSERPVLDGVEEELAQLARLALHGSDRDRELYVHRLASRHHGTSLGERLAAVDKCPPVSLRDDPLYGGKVSTEEDRFYAVDGLGQSIHYPPRPGRAL